MPRAVQIREYGSPSKALDVTDVAKPEPGQGEVLVKMKLRPVNPSDIYSIMGIYPGYKPRSLPATPGLEGMGVVESVGGGATRFKPGQRVVPLLLAQAQNTGNGSWQEYLAVKEADVVAIPDNVSDENAAQLVINPLTVIGLLNKLQTPKGQYIAQSAAGSTLGKMLIQVAHHHGIKTINLVRRAAAVDELKALGADVVIVTENKEAKDIAEEIKKAAGGYVHGAVDAVSGKAALALSYAVRNRGTIYNYGTMESPEASVSALDALFRGIIFTGYWVTSDFLEASKERQTEWIKETFDLMGQGIMVPQHGQRFKLDDVHAAVKKSNEVGRDGKVLLES
ncbi:hypothetical protein HK097_000199 [Rhizophlyctis rosea]|uniref:Enoyl reductase (ER) domain-containing protein n=1 Tax=Rhizophlyctis rosea TaxID=64517 RepID=A0AAD5X7P3_9FUNG|nr:hypothetical protein HK097_000199 [Rhizophlyctis rosea]